MSLTKFDFSVPQRQSLVGVFVLFANTLQKSVRAFWPIIIVFLFKNKNYEPFQVYISIFGIIVLISVIAFLRYWFFKFYIDYKLKEFVIENGIFNKTKTTIPFHKIQKVTIDQSIIQRIFNVHKIELDTAGSDKKEASIKAISHDMAVELKKNLLDTSAKENFQDKSGNNNIETSPSFITIGLPSLLKIGITANYLASFAYLVLLFSTLSENLRQIGREDVLQSNLNQLEQLPVMSLFFGFLIFIITAVLLINLVLTVVKYYNFTIKKDQESFVLTYGLFNIKNTIINPEKVQIIKLTQNFFQKKLNINIIEIFQASSDIKRASAKDKTKIPGCNKNEKEKIIRLLLDQLPNHEIVLYPNIRKLLINILFFIIIPISLGVFINSFNQRFSINTILVLTVIYTVLMGIILFFSFKNYRLFISDDYIIKQSGAWDIDQEIIMPYKVQAIKTHQFFWQKWTDIGSVVLFTAGGRISFSTTNYTIIKEQVNKWLYQVEVSTKNWM
ncbi:PH domain-containing protein [Flavobacterium sp. J27]|uniref:PH domain-containing protein n=1 Tax=Flavobacterium sp. J27 TaxID=2060419 RepID=UPI00102FD774|nr:PH domain-containing protein [Flavobacterium sp. J27]